MKPHNPFPSGFRCPSFFFPSFLFPLSQRSRPLHLWIDVRSEVLNLFLVLVINGFRRPVSIKNFTYSRCLPTPFLFDHLYILSTPCRLSTYSPLALQASTRGFSHFTVLYPPIQRRFRWMICAFFPWRDHPPHVLSFLYDSLLGGSPFLPPTRTISLRFQSCLYYLSFHLHLILCVLI